MADLLLEELVVKTSEKEINLPIGEIVDSLQKASRLNYSAQKLQETQNKVADLNNQINETAHDKSLNSKFVSEAGRRQEVINSNPGFKAKTQELRELKEFERSLNVNVSFNTSEILSEKSLGQFEKILKERSKYISSIKDFKNRKEMASNLVSSMDAFFCYLDLFYHGENKELKISEVLNDKRYQELLNIFSLAGKEAVDLLKEKGPASAGVPAKKYAETYLREQNIKLIEMNEDKARAAIKTYLEYPGELDNETRKNLAVKLRLANHTWKIDQIEREASGEDRLNREIYRTFGGIKYFKKEDDLVDELYKDWEHVNAILNL